MTHPFDRPECQIDTPPQFGESPTPQDWEEMSDYFDTLWGDMNVPHPEWEDLLESADGGLVDHLDW